MAGWQQAFGIDGQRHRGLKVFGQACQRSARSQRPATGQNQRPTCTGQSLSHLRHCLRCSPCPTAPYRAARQQEVGRFNQHIERDFDMHRAWPGTVEHGKCPGQHLRQVGCTHQGVGKRRHTRYQRGLVGQFVQLATATAQLVTGLHAGNHQHRDRVGIGLAHGSGDIGHARAGDNEAHPGFAAGTRIAVSHEPGTLLMTRGDVANGRARQATIELHGMYTGDAEDMIDAIAFKEFDQYFAAGCHQGSP